MASSDLQTYLASLPAASRKVLQALRAAIRAAAPGAAEGFGYGIPAFTLGSRPLVYCAAWKVHVSLYPLTSAMRRECAGALKRYETSKGTVRFPLDSPLPATLVRRLVKARVAELRATGAAARRGANA